MKIEGLAFQVFRTTSFAAVLLVYGLANPVRADDLRTFRNYPAPIPASTDGAGRTLGGAVNGSPSANCSCRYQGKDVLLGKSICMKTSNGFVQAQCSRYLNNTSWTITRTPCALS